MTNLIYSPELWADIPGFENKYQASTKGRIKALARKQQIKNAIGDVVLNFKEKILRQTFNQLGYLRIGLSINGINKSFPVHRLIALTFIPNPENKKTVNHKDGNKANNNVENLEWSTQKENVQHAFLTGLVKRKSGDKCYQSKFTNQQAKEVRESNKSVKELAKEYGVYISTIYKIKKGLRYKC